LINDQITVKGKQKNLERKDNDMRDSYDEL
jgi:hypothetical protein